MCEQCNNPVDEELQCKFFFKNYECHFNIHLVPRNISLSTTTTGITPMRANSISLLYINHMIISWLPRPPCFLVLNSNIWTFKLKATSISFKNTYWYLLPIMTSYKLRNSYGSKFHSSKMPTQENQIPYS